MGAGKKRASGHFDLSDIGFLGGPPLKGAAIVTEIAAELIEARSVALFAFDKVAGEAVVRTAARGLRVGASFPLHNSAMVSVDDQKPFCAIEELAKEVPNSVERTHLGMASVLAAAVRGPDGQPIGVLAVFDTRPRKWTEIEKRKLTSLAYLITQEVTLMASFATLKIMSLERLPNRA